VAAAFNGESPADGLQPGSMTTQEILLKWLDK
jgi:hypothetical protein